jgi:hypothetical protein
VSIQAGGGIVFNDGLQDQRDHSSKRSFMAVSCNFAAKAMSTPQCNKSLLLADFVAKVLERGSGRQRSGHGSNMIPCAADWAQMPTTAAMPV